MTDKPATVTTCDVEELHPLIDRRSGIVFNASRGQPFSSKVHEYMREKQIASVAELLRVVESDAEYDAMLEFLLEEKSSFFRYPAVFEALAKNILPELQEKKFWDSPRTLRIWSAGCSTGEEAYSTAVVIADHLPFAETWRIEILATDISRRALRHAERGVYGDRDVENLSAQQLENYFTKARHAYVVKPRIRRMVNFAPMNLTQTSNAGRMDCIFCLDVLSYFSAERRNAILQSFSECLEPGGYLVLGNIQPLDSAKLHLEFQTFGDGGIYQKPTAESAVRQAVVAEGSL
ncbi:MAG TPA: protein-glutamate O-methyltransferase CheR [Candidatus Acidoferrales bacterium]|nr:protein-glutamate O-methyltransferase CheR [Candidatus Acidoferrales bacterium]